jgi:hypothetical protein
VVGAFLDPFVFPPPTGGEIQKNLDIKLIPYSSTTTKATMTLCMHYRNTNRKPESIEPPQCTVTNYRQVRIAGGIGSAWLSSFRAYMSTRGASNDLLSEETIPLSATRVHLDELRSFSPQVALTKLHEIREKARKNFSLLGMTMSSEGISVFGPLLLLVLTVLLLCHINNLERVISDDGVGSRISWVLFFSDWLSRICTFLSLIVPALSQVMLMVFVKPPGHWSTVLGVETLMLGVLGCYIFTRVVHLPDHERARGLLESSHAGLN